jgi:hypothetical protein
MADEEKEGVPPKATPNAPRPITVRLKPVVPKSDTQRTAEEEARQASLAAPKETVVKAAAGPTARVPIPSLDDIDAKSGGAAQGPSTVRLRPVKVPGISPEKPVGGQTAAIPITPPELRDLHKPGGNPLPPGPKPPSEAQVHAAKSKTSRISLDAAIGVAPEGPMSGGIPKTIRLKRPAKLAGTGKMPTPATGPIEAQKSKTRTAPIGKTSRIPDEAIAKPDESATVTQKKTLKIKKKGGSPGAEDSGADLDGVEMTPIADLGMMPVKQERPVFTAIAGVFAIAAVIAGILLMICLGAHAVGPAAGTNDIATLRLGSTEMPWPGRISRF